MKNCIGIKELKSILGVMFLFVFVLLAQAQSNDGLLDRGMVGGGNSSTLGLFSPDSLSFGADSLLPVRRFIHRLGVDMCPAYILPTSAFFWGENEAQRPIRSSYSAHLKYSFGFMPESYLDRLYGGVYQGVGLAYFNFGEPRQIGNPLSLYLFQGARIKRFNPRLSLNYEWNLGLSFGWRPYDKELNFYNTVMGSEANAYMNADLYLNWMLSSHLDLTTGIALSHFSNGNTKYPNAGLNTAGLKLGLVYHFNRPAMNRLNPMRRSAVLKFPNHISYDLVLFGSWRRKGVDFADKLVPSPHAYPVFGFNFAPMYNFGYKFRAGLSLDGVWDGSANVYTEDYIVGTEQPFYTPSFEKQLALGLSGRVEYVMPFLTICFGLGTNVIYGGPDLKSVYQILALKIEVTRSSFIHIGYNLQNFHMPNYLMLGFGYRFNNKYPTLHR